MTGHRSHHRGITIDTDRSNGTRIVRIDFLNEVFDDQCDSIRLDLLHISRVYRPSDPIDRRFHLDHRIVDRPKRRGNRWASDSLSIYLIRMQCHTIHGGTDGNLSMSFGLRRSKFDKH